MTDETRQRRRSRKKKKNQKRKRTLLVIEIIVLFALVIGLFMLNKLDMINFDQDEFTVGTNHLDSTTEEIMDDYTTFAIFGVDNRTTGNYSSGRSDSIMIATINNETKEVKLMSVYRDTFLDVDSGSLQKCNAAYSKGGAQGAMEMLNKNLDLNIQEYVAVDFQAVVDVVDEVGGIELTITEEEAPVLNDYLPEVQKITGKESSQVGAGTQIVDGCQALSYCRIRYTQGDDFRRAERQRTVIAKIVEKAQQSDILKINKIIDVIFPEISISLSIGECVELAASLMEYKIVDNVGWPIDLRTATIGSKGSVDVPCTLESNVVKAHEFLYNEVDYKPTSSVLDISDKIKSNTGFSEDDAVNYLTW